MRSATLDQARGAAAERRVELDGDDELARREQPLRAPSAPRPVPVLERRRRVGDETWCRPVLVDGGADRGDLRRRRAAAAADQLRAERACAGRELGEVVGRRVRERHARAAPGGEADVRERRERRRPVRPAHLRRARRAPRPGREPWFAPKAATSSSARRAAAVPAVHAAHRHRVAVEAHQRHDRQAGDGTDGGDRDLELVEVVERLEHEHVGAAALEDPRLLGERRRPDRARRPARSSRRSTPRVR